MSMSLERINIFQNEKRHSSVFLKAFQTSTNYFSFHRHLKAFKPWNVFFLSSVNGSWSQWSTWQPCSVTCGGGHTTRSRTCSNPAPRWNGMDCPGTNISTESCNLHECKGRSQKLKTFKYFSLLNSFMSWIIPSDHQWMAIGLHKDHAVWTMEEGNGHVLAHVLIRRQNGTEIIHLVEISPQRSALFAVVLVDAYSERLVLKWFRLDLKLGAFLTWPFHIRSEFVFSFRMLHYLHRPTLAK